MSPHAITVFTAVAVSIGVLGAGMYTSLCVYAPDVVARGDTRRLLATTPTTPRPCEFDRLPERVYTRGERARFRTHNDYVVYTFLGGKAGGIGFDWATLMEGRDLDAHPRCNGRPFVECTGYTAGVAFQKAVMMFHYTLRRCSQLGLRCMVLVDSLFDDALVSSLNIMYDAFLIIERVPDRRGTAPYLIRFEILLDQMVKHPDRFTDGRIIILDIDFVLVDNPFHADMAMWPEPQRFGLFGRYTQVQSTLWDTDFVRQVDMCLGDTPVLVDVMQRVKPLIGRGHLRSAAAMYGGTTEMQAFLVEFLRQYHAYREAHTYEPSHFCDMVYTTTAALALFKPQELHFTPLLPLYSNIETPSRAVGHQENEYHNNASCVVWKTEWYRFSQWLPRSCIRCSHRTHLCWCDSEIAIYD